MTRLEASMNTPPTSSSWFSDFHIPSQVEYFQPVRVDGHIVKLPTNVAIKDVVIELLKYGAVPSEQSLLGGIQNGHAQASVLIAQHPSFSYEAARSTIYIMNTGFLVRTKTPKQLETYIAVFPIIFGKLLETSGSLHSKLAAFEIEKAEIIRDAEKYLSDVERERKEYAKDVKQMYRDLELERSLFEDEKAHFKKKMSKRLPKTDVEIEKFIRETQKAMNEDEDF